MGWFDASPGGLPNDIVVRPIKGLNLSTTLSLIRAHGEQRPAASMVWEIAKGKRSKRKAPHARRATSNA